MPASVTDAPVTTLTGPLLSVDHRTTRQDNGWVVLTVQTPTGLATCLVLPRMYQAGRPLLDELLTAGTAVTVTGRLDDRNGDIYVTDIRRAT